MHELVEEATVVVVADVPLRLADGDGERGHPSVGMLISGHGTYSLER
jgi:hypothetical protein